MSRPRLAALAFIAALAACGKSSAPTPGLHLNQPSAVAGFRGVTLKDPGNLRHPYLAIANSGSNDLTFADRLDNDKPVLAPLPLRSLVYTIPGRPTLLASADLGDQKPDLLVAVSAGDSKLQVVRTWSPDGGVEGEVEIGVDILALVAVPSPPGTARIAAALAGEQLAVVTFTRVAGGDAIDVAAAQPSLSGSLGFQPLAIAATPDDPTVDGIQTRVWAATRDEVGGVHGVVGIDISGSPPWPLQVLDARAPTRLVAAARLAERPPGITPIDASAFSGQPTLERVYAVLDESGCGLHAEIACGVVALDPSGIVTADPAGELPFHAPIQVPGAARGLAATQPPAFPPSAADPEFAGTYMRMVTAVGTRTTTAAAAVASTDGYLYFIDLGRWEMPADRQLNGQAVINPTATPVTAVNPQASATIQQVTAGYTPTTRWTATWQGALPGLSSRPAESGPGAGGLPWLALQTLGGVGDVVSVYDPTVRIRIGDLAVISFDPGTLGTCTSSPFEATVDGFISPLSTTSTGPGGALQLGKITEHPEWDSCVDALATYKTHLLATIRGGEWVLVRGTGTDAVLVGRPEADTPTQWHMAVAWENEAALSCPAPPVTSCDDTCRLDCEQLLLARIARRIGYAPEQGDPTGPALAFTLALRSDVTTKTLTRDFAVAIDTSEGRSPFRVVPPNVAAIGPGLISTFDASADIREAGVRFLVPYESNVALDTTPTLQGGVPSALH